MIPEPLSRGGYDVGQLQEWPRHLLPTRSALQGWVRGQMERVERAGGGFQMPFGNMEVAAGGFQVGMAEQQLNGAKVRPVFEQVGCEAVAQGMWVHVLLQSGALGRCMDGVPDALGLHGNVAIGLGALAGK